jgi:hypothetical protein
MTDLLDELRRRLPEAQPAGVSPLDLGRRFGGREHRTRVGRGRPSGGTIATEHGIGTLERSYLERELDPVQLEVRRASRTLDPDRFRGVPALDPTGRQRLQPRQAL